MKIKLLGIYLLLLLITACSADSELEESIFIPDEDNPSLPAYTEWGYNTFGAYYDRKLFVYNNDEIPVKVINTGGKTSFILKGQKGSASYSYSYYDEDYTPMSMTFDLYGFSPKTISDLLVLNDTIFDLTNSLCKVSVTMDDVIYDEAVFNGTLVFKRAQNLIVDKKQVEIILSGTFEFQALIGAEPISVSSGRFDLGIGTDNFYYY
jgi:hypothetical protein